ncbi:Replication factor C (RF-C) subunit [Conglomerata obtusa]
MLLHTCFQPKTLSSLNHHPKIVDLLSSYTPQTCPHLIIHGPPGSSKRTLTNALLNTLFPQLSTNLRSTSIKDNQITYLESQYHLELTPSDYFNDKIVIQQLIKQTAQTRNVLGLVNKQVRVEIKYIIIHGADRLSKDAQAALRRTVERFSSNFRIIMICEEISSVLEALRSRCLCVRVNGFDDPEIYKCYEQSQKIIKGEYETFDGTNNCIENKINNSLMPNNILKSANGNLRKALCLLELNHTKKVELEYERNVKGIVNTIIQKQDGNSVLAVRKEIYMLLNNCVPAQIVLKELVRNLIKKCKGNNILKICEYGSLYEERIALGNKDILHLEGFVVAAMCLFYK